MISLMQETDRRLSERRTSRRDILAAGIAGAVVLMAPAVASIDPDARLRAIVQTYGGEFGPARKGSVNHGRL
jgi:hypothetical protein